MKAIVDPDTCTGCGLCVEICPEVFEMKDEVAVAKAGMVPVEKQDTCREAKDSCPVEAISIQE
ncbi:MAG: ferredoxin [Candidatus Sumerlaeota bacterium]|nr:ferredoxin [Candidatus Sumerlaeota bacterium]